MTGYAVGLSKRLTARHYFTEGATEAEKVPHVHDYRVELIVHGRDLDRNGYLIDLDEIDTVLKELIAGYDGRLLNELPQFAGVPPSLEHLARIMCTAFSGRLQGAYEGVTVKVWESEWAWASFHQDNP